MNPWKVVGWIVVAVLVLLLATCSLFLYGVGKATTKKNGVAVAAVGEHPKPKTHQLQVISIECASHGLDRADITVRNTGETTISFAKAFVQFKDKSGSVIGAHDSYFSPNEIPPGAVASADVYSNGTGAYTCGLIAVQDSNGIAAALSQ